MTTISTNLDAPEEAQSVQTLSPVAVGKCQSALSRKDPVYQPHLAVISSLAVLIVQPLWQYPPGTPGIHPETHNLAFSHPASPHHLHRPSPHQHPP